MNKRDPIHDEEATSEKKVTQPVLWHARDLQPIMGGTWVGQVSGDICITGVNYYPGQVEPGDLVFTTEQHTWRSAAYKNTNKIIAKLFDQKHAAVIVASQLPENQRSENPVLLVEDTRLALDKLAAAARDRMSGTVVAITGSAGKTTTKEITRFLLSEQAITKGSRKNYNNGPGVSLMLAETPPNIRFGVYEFSVDLPRVTEKKAKIISPDVVVITNIHADHLQFYGTLEKLTDQKCLLFKALKPDGVVVLNRDSTLFEQQLGNARKANVNQVTTFGLHDNADMQVVEYSLKPESSDVTIQFHGKKMSFRVNQPGIHIVMDCLGALAAVQAAGGNWLQAAGDIARAPILGRRNEHFTVEVSDGSITLIDDTFSANPASMQAGLGVLGLTEPSAGGRRIAVMGEIKELGDTSLQLHTALAPHVFQAGVDVLFTVGRDLQGMWQALPEKMRGLHSENPEQIAMAVVKEMRGGDIVWVKGSRRSTANLEMILSAITQAGKTVRKKKPNEVLAQSISPQNSPREETSKHLILPDANTADPSLSSLEVVFVGDTAFGENYQELYEDNGEPNILKQRGYDAPLAKVHDILIEADLVIANLETPLTDLKISPLSGAKTWIHWGDVRRTPYHLLSNNIKVVSLANNHMFDYGTDGFLQTTASLDLAGIAFFGAGKNLGAAGQSFIWQRTINGQGFTLAVIAMYVGPAREKDAYGVYASEAKPGLNPVSLKGMRHEIRRIKQRFSNAFVVLFPHWGANYQWRTERQAKLAASMLAEGADLILGHGAHMLQEIQRSDQRWIVFGIGNFMFNSKGRYDKLGAPPYSLIAQLRVDVHQGSLKKSLRLYPIVTDNRITDYQTRFVTEREFEEVVSLLDNRYTGGFSNDVRCAKEENEGQTRFYIELPL